MRSLLGGIVLVVVLAFAPAAAAEQRYAAPDGGGLECTRSAPCALDDAIEEAFPDDEVIVLAGTYPVFSSIEPLFRIAIHGDFSGPMPRIVGSTGPEEAPLALFGSSSIVEYLDITNTAALGATGIACSFDQEINRVRIKVLGGDRPVGISTFGGCTFRNSLIVAEGERAQAVSSTGRNGDSPARFSNVTAIAHGQDSLGLFVTYFTEPEVLGSYDAIVRNSIFHGDKADIDPGLSGWGPGRVDIGHSNFATVGTSSGKVIDRGGNQSAPPQFVSSAAGDYTEAASSPTIGTGLLEAAVGPFDLAGNPRVFGGGIDIGAFEFVPPPPPPPPPLLAIPTITSLKIKPATFRVAGIGGAIVSARKKPKGPAGAQVTYDLSAATTVSFTVSRKGVGRRAGGKCVKRTKANKAKRKCPLLKPVPGKFTHTGAAGTNAFKFSGRLTNKSLSPGSYVLAATVGASSKSVGFKIVK
jgi:hypothetical protein